MNKIFIRISLTFMLLALSLPSAQGAASSKCANIGDTKQISGKNYTCKTSNGILKWILVTKLPNCSPNKVYDLRDLKKQYQETLAYPELLAEQIESLKWSYLEKAGQGDLEAAMRVQMNIDEANRLIQVAKTKAQKIAALFNATLAKCKVPGLSLEN